jgi:hypothetical protein
MVVGFEVEPNGERLTWVFLQLSVVFQLFEMIDAVFSPAFRFPEKKAQRPEAAPGSGEPGAVD